MEAWRNMPKWMKILFGVIGGLFALVLVAVAAAPDEPEPAPTPIAADVSARQACRHWGNVAADIQAGILTEEELREKLREVNESASVSNEAPVRVAAEQMLRGVTQSDSEEIQAGVTAMQAACHDVLTQ